MKVRKNIIPKKYRPLSKLGHVLPFISGIIVWNFPQTCYTFLQSSQWVGCLFAVAVLLAFTQKLSWDAFKKWPAIMLACAAAVFIFTAVTSFVLNTIVLGSAEFYSPDLPAHFFLDKLFAFMPKLILLWGGFAILAHYAASRQQVPSIGSIALLTLPSPLNKWFAHYRNMLCLVSNAMVFGFGLLGVMMAISGIISAQQGWLPVNAIPVVSGAGVVLFLPLFTYEVITKRFFRRFGQLPAPYIGFYSLLLVGGIGLSLALSKSVTEVASHVGMLPSPMSEVVILAYTQGMDVATRLDFFFVSWCLITVPLMGSLFSRFFAAMPTYILALSLAGLAGVAGYFSGPLKLVLLEPIAHWQLLLGAGGAVLCTVLFFRGYKNTDVFILGFCKTKQHSVKSHGFSKKARFLGLFFLVFLQTHTMSGWFGLQSFTSMVAVLFALSYFLTTLAFIVLIFRKTFIRRAFTKSLNPVTE